MNIDALRRVIGKIQTWQWILIVLALLVVLDAAIRRPDARSRELNRAIAAEASQQLRDYPYPFRVLRVSGSTAVMGTPRNYEMPAFKVLGALYPKVNVKDANNPAFIALEKTLGEVQGEARAIVLRQPGIKSVLWELDRDWLNAHYIDPPAN